MDKVAMEFEALKRMTVSDLTPYRAIETPALVIMGEQTRQPAKAVGRVLAETLPNARLATLPGAGHISPFTHCNQLNCMIIEHIGKSAMADVLLRD